MEEIPVPFKGKIYNVPRELLGLTDQSTNEEMLKATEKFMTNPPPNFPDGFELSPLSEQFGTTFSPMPSKYDEKHFRIIFDNALEGNNKLTAFSEAPYLITYFGDCEAKLISMKEVGKHRLPCFVSDQKDALRFQNEPEARAWLRRSIEMGLFDLSYPEPRS